LQALRTWRHYFLGGSLILKTNQQSLKYMMTQRLIEGIQHKLLMKLLEFDCTIEYKKGIENTVAGALSWKDQSTFALTTSTPAWIADIEASYHDDPHLTTILQQLLINAKAVPDYSVHSGIPRHKGRICIGANSDIKDKILSSLHPSAIRGHSGSNATYHKSEENFLLA
jgi:hypothetical protein